MWDSRNIQEQSLVRDTGGRFFFGDLDNTPSLGKEKSYQPTCVEILLRLTRA